MVEAQRKGTGPESTKRLPTKDQPDSHGDSDLTPKQIVAELDRYIVGQHDAKRAVAVALRNRFRRQRLDEEMRREVQPRNILMIGSTGVGKTEIARRVARIVDAPFVKVEATKFTEVGYVGRDVESIVRDLVEIAISMLHKEQLDKVREQAARAALEKLAEIVADQELQRKPRRSPRKNGKQGEDQPTNDEHEAVLEERRRRREQKRVRQLLDQEVLDDETVEIDVESDDNTEEFPVFDVITGINPEEFQDTMFEFLEGIMPRRRSRRRVSVREARGILAQQEANRLVDFDALVELAIKRVENSAVVFIDEIDKTISGDGDTGPDVSGEGVQRDLLPIVEGSAVMTRYGPVNTDHVLFIAAGSFHRNKPSDLIPEFQGRFPVRVELQSLGEEELFTILTEPRNALTKQVEALLATEGLEVDFTQDGLREIARLADRVNQQSEDIGARRLQTILERVIEEISFNAPELTGTKVEIDQAYVLDRVADIADDRELSDFIL
jgi:ATP-dependent HslUV protease ATP-binding subunit HslU